MGAEQDGLYDNQAYDHLTNKQHNLWQVHPVQRVLICEV